TFLGQVQVRRVACHPSVSVINIVTETNLSFKLSYSRIEQALKPTFMSSLC
ncbi:hypothetical protein LTSERUB_6672, partial [Salmonella enterica subsp. enterica serovar Rubislaw str. A4-653]